MSLLELVILVFLFNLETFGNGPTMFALLQDSLGDERGILSDDQLLYAFTLARVTPGQANTYVAAIGYFLYGWPGAILTSLAILLPGYLILPLLGGYEHLRSHPAVGNFTSGLQAASVGLIFAATVNIARRSLTEPVGWVVFPLTLFLAYRLRWNTIVSLVVASAVGIVLQLALLNR